MIFKGSSSDFSLGCSESSSDSCDSSFSLLITFMLSSLTVTGIGTIAANKVTTASPFVLSILTTFAFYFLNGSPIISTISPFSILISSRTGSIMFFISEYSTVFPIIPFTYGRL